MDPLEEQQQEIEVLQSIYPDELELISPTHFTIFIALDAASDRKHLALLDVRYPPNYPEEVPKLDILTSVEEESEDEALDSEDESEKFVSLSEQIVFDRDDIGVLLTKLNEEAEMNIGMPSIFALAALLKDEAELLFQAKLDAAQAQYDKELLAREAEEQKKFHGTKVTKQSYAEWREKFRVEMQVEKKDLERFERMHNGKMTGREIFEKGLAEESDDELADVTDSVAKVAV
ncbi:CIC11C00000000556 [Sungouiella intermedia]|uniref:CIC11C00000000556 n=1 Tax=Sungouiella intermedia TaxID=45354 RepID=A0A1L0B746_9ASCO|nr:CIC11C00000000556 [[Candida] intermedia]